MEDHTITPQRISIDYFLTVRNQKIKPIDGLNVPNITMPPHLVSKKRSTEAGDTLSINIRHLFNSLTDDNIVKVKNQLKEIVYAKAKTIEMLNEIAEEVLQNFLISDKYIKNYMQLLNGIWNAQLLVPNTNPVDKKVSPSIGNLFLAKCKDMIFLLISEKNIRRLAELDQDDPDQQDTYNREREKIINLIVTICSLYEQRNTPLIKLTALQLYFVMKHIIEYYNTNQMRMKELGNPYEEDCSNEGEYETCRKMCTLYAEQLYTFMFRQGKDFIQDSTVIKDDKETTLQNLVERFKMEMVPTLTEAFLKSKCGDLLKQFK